MNRGFTLIELATVLVVIGILSLAFSSALVNNRGATEKRAYEAANAFVKRNGIQVKRMSCAGDSDSDGYGTCNIVDQNDNPIILNCPVSFVGTKIFGASGCKEIIHNVNLQ